MSLNREKDMRTSFDRCMCPECHDTGYVVISKITPETTALYGKEEPHEFAVKCPRCNGGQLQRAEEIHSRAEIPQAFYDKRMDSFKWDIYQNSEGKIIDLSNQERYVKSFIDDFKEWEKQGLGLYIWSHMRGSGKTFLASCICNELIFKYPMSTRFVSANKLIDIARSGDRSSRDVYEQDPIELLCKCKLLVIDDLGQNTSGGNWLNDILFRITDSRLQNGLVTVVTSNIKLTDLNMDDRVVDRIYKMCQPIPLPDFAVRQREANTERVNFLKKMGLTRKETA